MEPRPFSHGYENVRIEHRLQLITLQWSHGLSAMDTRDIRAEVIDSGIRLQWSHGLSAMDTRYSFTAVGVNNKYYLQWSHGLSAMDTAIAKSWLALDVALQWSHGLSAMDTIASGLALIISWYLQWSHGLSAMDTRVGGRAFRGDQVPSMEPRPFSHGYFGHRSGNPPHRQAFNGATAFQPWIPGTEVRAMSLL